MNDFELNLNPSMRARMPALRALFACAAVALSACGGGGGGDGTVASSPAPSPAPAPSPSPAPAPSAASSLTATSYWVAGITGPNVPSLGASTLYVLDPDNPTQPVYSKALTSIANLWQSGEIGSSVWAARNISRTSDVTYLENNTVQYLDLKRTATLVPRQLSQAANVCQPQSSSRTYGDGYVDEYSVFRTASTACTSSLVGDGFALYPSSLAATDASPYRWVNFPFWLFDHTTKTGLVGTMEAGSGSTYNLALYQRDGTRIASVANGSGFASSTWGPTIGTAEAANNNHLAYFGTGVGGTLRRLTFTSTSASLSAPLHTFTSSTRAFGQSASAVYFVDGQTVNSIATGSSTVSNVMTAPSTLPISALHVYADVIAAYGNPTSGCPTSRKCTSVLTVPTAGGSVTTRTYEGTTTLSPTPFRVNYADNTFLVVAPTDAGLHDLSLVNAVTGAQTSLATAVRYVGQVLDNKDLLVQYAPVISGVLYCTPVGTGTSCAGGKLMQRDFGSTSAIELGSVPSPLAYQPSFFAAAGVTTAVNFSVASLNSDLYIVTGGTANSLKFAARQP